ncbi:hypothetical protein PG993_001006 [Apiospora rasikravindrae]|uniref:Uncharacterized protein n=1 Tax=Apiospora rasikravindrae TaxID=990691 RepID=A0ABR1UA70_9PEZI
MHTLTLPYYRFFRQNTLLPIQAIAKAIDVGRDEGEIRSMVARWRARKLYELHYIQIAGTLLSGAVIGCFSWGPRDQEYWLGPAAWYSCLILSLFAILLSSSEAFIFSNFRAPGPRLAEQPPLSPDLHAEVSMIIRLDRGLGDGEQELRQRAAVASPDDGERGKPVEQRHRNSPPPPPPAQALVRWNMVFTWQAPMMLLSYSVVAFLTGVTVYVCTPLYADDESLGGSAAAYFYLAWFTVAAAIFVWCSFWAYKFVDLDHI